MIDRNKYFWIIIVFFLVTGILVYRSQFGSTLDAVQNSNNLPVDFGEWKGSDIPYDEKVFKTLGADVTFFRKYMDGEGSTVDLYIAYYQDMQKADLSHAPIICYTGQGWTILDEGYQKIYVNPSEITINNMLIQKGLQRMVIFYWYQLSDKAVASHIKQKIFLTWDRLLGRENTSAFIRVSTPVQENSVDHAIEVQEIFVKEAYPYILRIFQE